MIRRLLSLFATRTVRIPAGELTITDEQHIHQIWEETRPTPEDQAVLDLLRAEAPLNGFDAAKAAHQKAEAARLAGIAQARAQIEARNAEDRPAVRPWPAVPTPPPAPRPLVSGPRLAGGTHGFGLKRAATVDEDLKCVDRLDLTPARKQWLKAQISAGKNLWDLLAQDDWDDLPTPVATPTEEN